MKPKFDISEFNVLLIEFSLERMKEERERNGKHVDQIYAKLTNRLYKLADYLNANDCKLAIIKDE